MLRAGECCVACSVRVRGSGLWYGRFAAYPYAPGATGWMMEGAVADGKEWLGHFGLERGLEVDDIDRTGVTLFTQQG